MKRNLHELAEELLKDLRPRMTAAADDIVYKNVTPKIPCAVIPFRFEHSYQDVVLMNFEVLIRLTTFNCLYDTSTEIRATKAGVFLYLYRNCDILESRR